MCILTWIHNDIMEIPEAQHGSYGKIQAMDGRQVVQPFLIA